MHAMALGLSSQPLHYSLESLSLLCNKMCTAFFQRPRSSNRNILKLNQRRFDDLEMAFRVTFYWQEWSRLLLFEAFRDSEKRGR